MRTLLPAHSGTMSPLGVADAHRWPNSDGAYIRAVMVSTSDGAARSPQGLSGGISNAGDRLLFNTIRGMSDVVLVGAETVRREGYAPLKVPSALAKRRAANGQADLPRVAIVTRTGQLNLRAPLFQTQDNRPLVFVPAKLPEDRVAALAEVADVIPMGDDAVDLGAAIDFLDNQRLTRIVCEGGPSLLAEVASLGRLNELCLTITPLLAGGSYADELPLPRILSGAALPVAPQQLHLEHILEDSGTIFLRYTVQNGAAAPAGVDE